MKNYNFIFFLGTIGIVMINACNPQAIPLKGNYGTGSFETTSTKSVDSIWSNLSDLFNQHGLPVANIDKKKGVITTAKTPFSPFYTFENEGGQLEQPKAWVVLSTVVENKKPFTPKTIYSRWSITITTSEDGLARIKVDPAVICNYYPNSFTSIEMHGFSTGRLEELITRSSMKNSK